MKKKGFCENFFRNSVKFRKFNHLERLVLFSLGTIILLSFNQLDCCRSLSLGWV